MLKVFLPYVLTEFICILTTTVQSPLKMPKKPVVTTNNRLFLVLVVTVQNQQIYVSTSVYVVLS